ncbi:hypothetical protein Q8F55_009200 [Vanrija albida]|uniref:Uncharacterized protein n=1 Tax=Vanrija albida TaxID=181172 RepID=A0ABR3PSZ5_9TREE
MSLPQFATPHPPLLAPTSPSREAQPLHRAFVSVVLAGLPPLLLLWSFGVAGLAHLAGCLLALAASLCTFILLLRGLCTVFGERFARAVLFVLPVAFAFASVLLAWWPAPRAPYALSDICHPLWRLLGAAFINPSLYGITGIIRDALTPEMERADEAGCRCHEAACQEKVDV